MKRKIRFSLSLPQLLWRWACCHAPYVVQESRGRLEGLPPEVVSIHWSLRGAIKSLKRAGQHYSHSFMGHLSYDLIRRNDGLKFVLTKEGGYFSDFMRISHVELVSASAEVTTLEAWKQMKLELG